MNLNLKSQSRTMFAVLLTIVFITLVGVFVFPDRLVAVLATGAISFVLTVAVWGYRVFDDTVLDSLGTQKYVLYAVSAVLIVVLGHLFALVTPFLSSVITIGSYIGVLIVALLAIISILDDAVENKRIAKVRATLLSRLHAVPESEAKQLRQQIQQLDGANGDLRTQLSEANDDYMHALEAAFTPDKARTYIAQSQDPADIAVVVQAAQKHLTPEIVIEALTNLDSSNLGDQRWKALQVAVRKHMRISTVATWLTDQNFEGGKLPEQIHRAVSKHFRVRVDEAAIIALLDDEKFTPSERLLVAFYVTMHNFPQQAEAAQRKLDEISDQL